MRAVGIALLLLVAGVACGSAGASSSGERDASRSRPALGIVGLDPLTVRGRGFVPRERVKLLLGTPPRTTSARADGRGRFTVRFGIRAARCSGAVVQAFGSRGSRAQVDVTAPGCAAPGSLPGERP